MIFSDPATKLGIVEKIDDLCDSDSTSYPTAQKTGWINSALEGITSEIIGVNGVWQFDDSNFTSLPIGTIDLVDQQQDYSFDVTMLDIERVEVKDVGGIWHKLNPIEKDQIDWALEEYQKNAGLPNQYDKNGGSIFLYPKPGTAFVTLTAGLKVYFQRTASLFTAADTTKVPGFASPFHIYLAYEAAIPYCRKYHPERVNGYMLRAAEIKRDCLDFYSDRDKDFRTRLSNAPVSFR